MEPWLALLIMNDRSSTGSTSHTTLRLVARPSSGCVIPPGPYSDRPCFPNIVKRKQFDNYSATVALRTTTVTSSASDASSLIFQFMEHRGKPSSPPAPFINQWKWPQERNKVFCKTQVDKVGSTKNLVDHVINLSISLNVILLTAQCLSHPKLASIHTETR